MAVSQGFWSYVHDDNRVEGNRIADLAVDVADQYRLLTTDEVVLFRDKDHLNWGEDWKLRIDEVLVTATFFIPVITPRYFQRPECRRELDLFTRRAVELDVSALVLPIVYVDFPALHERPSDDPLVTLITQLSWVDWTRLRFTARDSPEYRRAVADLAERLAAASAAAEGVPLPALEPEDGPTYLDLLATTEDTVAAWLATTDAINAKLTEVGVIMQRLVRKPRTYREQVETANLLATALSRPVADLQRLSTEFVVQLHEIDQGVRRIAERAHPHARDNPDLTDPVADLAADLRTQVVKEVAELEVAEPLIEIVTDIERVSRTLRPTARSLRTSLTLLADGRDLMATWPPLLDRLPAAVDGSRTR